MATASVEEVETFSDHPHEISPEELARLAADKPIRAYLAGKFESDAKRHWDIFYRNHRTNFFKDRHWLEREFEPLGIAARNKTPAVLLEIGCGVGNAVFPLLASNPSLRAYACDLSPRAVDHVKAHEAYAEGRCTAFQCDLTADDLCSKSSSDDGGGSSSSGEGITPGTVDFCTALFVLSAMSLTQIPAAIRNVARALKPGGRVFFRDYAIHDHAQLRFKPGHKISDNFYVRQDGTRAYYFRAEELSALFTAEGLFEEQSVVYASRKTVNKKEGLTAARTFVQATFVRSGVFPTNDADAAAVAMVPEAAKKAGIEEASESEGGGGARAKKIEATATATAN